MGLTDPRHAAGGVRGPTWGWFFEANGSYFLRAADGSTTWPVERVTILQGEWGYDHEGVEKLPRPRVESNGQVLVQGDRVIIDFADGDFTRPFVRGGLRSLKTTDFLARDHATTGANPNRLRVRVAPKDSQGNETGDVRLKVADGDLGTVELLATESVIVEIGSNLDGSSFLSMHVDSSGVRISQAGAPVAVILAPTFCADLAATLTELAAAATALGLPTVSTASQIAKLATTTYHSTKLTTE
jgi:hypothetical protein